MLPIIKREVVERFAWLSDEEFVDTLAAHSRYGAIAVNLPFLSATRRGCAKHCWPTGAVLPHFWSFSNRRLLSALQISNSAGRFYRYSAIIAALIAAAVWKVGKPSSKTGKDYLCPGLLLLSQGLRIHMLVILWVHYGLLHYCKQKRRQNRERG